jgi:hypothetical protein
MSIPQIRALLAAAVALLLSAVAAFADGKMYYSEKVPATIPYQRALILHDEGVQTLVLQSQYEIPGDTKVRSLGWVVPVPAPPEVASLPAESADLVFSWLDMATRPKVTRISDYVYTSLLLVGLSLTIGCPIAALIVRTGELKRRLLRIAGYSLAFTVCFFVFLLFAGARAWKGAAGVEIVSSHHTGIYEVKVVRSKDVAELIAWLNANSFQFGAEDTAAIQSYLDRGWCFVVAKIDPSISKSEVVSKGLLAPLVLRFPSPNPVYPVALTATGGHSTEILIYLASNTPMATDSALTQRFSGESRSAYSALIQLYTSVADTGCEFFEAEMLAPRLRWIGKFKAKLTPAQMARDIEFRPAPDAADYREHIYRW